MSTFDDRCTRCGEILSNSGECFHCDLLPPRVEWIREQISQNKDHLAIGRGLVDTGMSEEDAKYLLSETYPRSQRKIAKQLADRRREWSVQPTAQTEVLGQQVVVGVLFYLLRGVVLSLLLFAVIFGIIFLS